MSYLSRILRSVFAAWVQIASLRSSAAAGIAQILKIDIHYMQLTPSLIRSRPPISAVLKSPS